jgi:hypothetical protein
VLERCGVSPTAYVESNPDLAQLPDGHAAMAHLIAGGLTEERRFPINLDLDGLGELAGLSLALEFRAAAAATLINNCIAPASAFWDRAAGEQRAFWARLVTILRGIATPYFVVGDSHSGLYRQAIAGTGGDRPLLPVHVLFSACSAQGLGNPASKSGAARRLAPLAEALTPDTPAIFKFGQVDVEFVFAFKRIEAEQVQFDLEEFDRFCRRSVLSYVGFLHDRLRGRDVTVASIFPPTLSDEAWREGYVNAHIAAQEGDRPIEAIVAGLKQLEVPGLAERSRHHAHYNEILRHQAQRSGFAFIDDFSPFVGVDGVIDPVFTPTTRGRDHHLERSPATPIIRRLITAAVVKDCAVETEHARLAGYGVSGPSPCSAKWK